jgi:hypothetical protein
LNASLSSGEQDQNYADTLVAIGGTTPYQWIVLSGALPPGLSLSNDGILSGIPISTGNFPVTIRVIDNVSVNDNAAFILHISPPLSAPEDLTLTTDDIGNILLNWQAVSEVDSYAVYRATFSDFSDGILIGSTAATSFTDTPAAETDAIRFYRVYAIRQ